MPFDYNSFLQGVQTGLRLGRTKQGRQPPVPSDGYILTETGIPIITEKKTYSEATVLSPGVYQGTRYDGTYTYSNPYDYGTLEIVTASGVSAPEIKFFWRIDPNGSYISQFIFCDASEYTPAAWGNGMFYKFSGVDHGYYQQAGSLNNFYESQGIRWATVVGLNCRPDNIAMFRGTEQEALDWVTSVDYRFMITE